MQDSDPTIAGAIAAISRIGAVPSLLRLICENTGMGFAAVARVTDSSWTACAVLDNIGFGLQSGGQLAIETTLCREVRAACRPVVIDHVSEDPVYRDHPTPRLYKFQSYISVPILRKDGAYFGNLCAIDPHPAKVSEPRTLTMLTLFADLIAMQLESEDRQQATESALHTERATAELREQFIAVLGHDLRSPVAAISATGALLSRREQPDLIKLGKRLRATGQRMSQLIDDVLDFTRGRLGQGMGVKLCETDDLAAALQDVVAELREANPDRMIADSITISTCVVCDKGRLQQLVSNLLGNALTYGAPQFPVRVEASVEDGTLVLAVTNNGEPIAPENLDKVFEPYWRPSTSKPGGGLGLGLHICALIVKAHHGTIEVRSSIENGTRFTARLPLGGAGPAQG